MAALTPVAFGGANYVDPFSGVATGAAQTGGGFPGTGSGFQGNRIRFLGFTGVNNADTFTFNLGNVLGIGWFGGTGSAANQCNPTFSMTQTSDGQWQTTVTFNTPGAVVGMLCVVSAN